MLARVRNHLLFWLTYVCFKSFLNYSVEEPFSWKVVGLLLMTQIAFLVVKLPLVYTSFYVTDKYLKSRWSLSRVITGLSISFLGCSYFMWLLNIKWVLPQLYQVDTTNARFSLESLVYYFFTLLFVVGIALAIRLFRRQYDLQLNKAHLEKEMAEAELKYLKGQINPHFLFNTLNNIYSLARKGSANTAESVLKLSVLMRFMLYEASRKEIPLSAELKIIGDYIDLEKLRYAERCKIDFITDIDNPEQPIAPLLLIHFVENAFKHGASEARSDIYIRIFVHLQQGALTVEISNPIASEHITKEPLHIGLNNIKRQLNLLYPGHVLNIQTRDDRFVALLTIPLNQLE